MNIAIDLDGTLDKLDMRAWKIVVTAFSMAGCRVFLVTSRNDGTKQITQQWAEAAGIDRCCVIYTNGEAKKWHCEKRGLKIDIWIDDDPGSILNGK